MTDKILIVRFSSIGDIVLTTPVIRAVKKQYNHGDVEVHYLTKAAYSPILAANPYIDHLHTIERNVTEVTDHLKQYNYHYVIDLHNNLRSLQLRTALGRPSRALAKLSLRRWLFINFKINLLPHKHIVDRYMDVARPLGVVNDNQGLDYFLRPQDEIDPTALPASHRQSYIAIVIGGQHEGKLYPRHLLLEVCRQLACPVMLLGGPEDQQRGEWIAQQAGALVFNACGKFTLNQTATLVRDAQCVISNDTGLMHIAAAFKKKVISLWGATVPEFGMSPYLPGPGSQILEAQSWQRPYSKHGKKALFRAAYNCWKGLAPERIVAAALGHEPA